MGFPSLTHGRATVFTYGRETSDSRSRPRMRTWLTCAHPTRPVPLPAGCQGPIFTAFATVTWSMSETRTVTFIVQVPASGTLRVSLPQ